ncbi:hypothetical protein EDD63_1635 [Breznakia blatticola]|uniref:Uncharacterized protein n=1 Tax=Breznakia blatticola TaxID=1754012 RepID=A0A4V3G642_9FIRM|nr:hypothetical protein [Breznakia sp. PH1-1]MDH6403374.1 hypothetical protein [Breznakia sp. PF1-11]MDH6411083.1 hypothetical protein [Breznakia sp. PFB1-11]MDH6413447.1 hypothetical protein [Breznakia sp. PFB1-14]MDH6416764.1 hypothetical protein [Breznakia sp. PFB1-4]MDH6417973.1 hypothetical protein [Breznakia sp. PFB1-12]MDH6473112.1 hypothetical protein [Breznakia sp. PFB2-30]MDH6475555.1 hypothetical protein [Breznakia sp. PFB1-19]TDW09096.1 hypothetical protein EDD63_1635 [Breznakia
MKKFFYMQIEDWQRRLFMSGAFILYFAIMSFLAFGFGK